MKPWWHSGRPFMWTACSLAAALALLLSLGHLEAESRVQPRHAPAPSQQRWQMGSGAIVSSDFASPLTYYLVSSEEDRAVLLATYDFPADHRILVIVSRLDESGVSATPAELTSLGRSVEIVDLRAH